MVVGIFRSLVESVSICRMTFRYSSERWAGNKFAVRKPNVIFTVFLFKEFRIAETMQLTEN